MTDISQIKALHDLRSNFAVEESDMERFYAQIKAEAVASNAERFYKGFSIEDDFRTIFSALPWVKLIHGLDQEQSPGDSKKEFQVPDFILHFELYDLSRMPVLIEVKSVTGDGMSLQLSKKQVDSLSRYSEVMGMPLLFAIYWVRFKTWTVNTIENFESKKSKFKISFFSAYSNNLSMVFFDPSFINEKTVYKKVVYTDESNDPEGEKHPIHGFVESRSISTDGITYSELSALDSSILNTALPMQQVGLIKEPGRTILQEERRIGKSIKISDEITRYLSAFFGKPQEQYAKMACHLLLNICRRLEMRELYMVPKVRTNTSDRIFSKALPPDWLEAHYFAER